MRGRTRVCETCQAYIQITYVVPFFTDTELARRTTEFERNNIVGTSVAARRMRSPPPPSGRAARGQVATEGCGSKARADVFERRPGQRPPWPTRSLRV